MPSRSHLIPSFAIQQLAIVTGSPINSGTVGIPYVFGFNAIGGVQPYTWSLPIPGNLTPGLSLSAAGTITGTPTTAGTDIFAVTVTDSIGMQATAGFQQTVNPTANPLTITTTSPLPNATVGVGYGPTAMQATGGTAPYTWQLLAGTLPPNMTLSAAGNLAGTPLLHQTVSLTIQCTDAINTTVNGVFSLTVANLNISTTSPLPAAQVGQAYSFSFVEAGGTAPFTWAKVSGTLAAGLTFNAPAGTITGTPTNAETDSIVVSVTDSATNSAARDVQPNRGCGSDAK